MDIPGFAAEASLYKTGRVYRGYSRGGDTAPSVVAALSCDNACHLDLATCIALCGFLDFPCDALCGLHWVQCNNQCPSGGGVGGRQPACPKGTKCCGQFIKHPGGITECDGDCIPIGQKCVVGV